MTDFTYGDLAGVLGEVRLAVEISGCEPWFEEELQQKLPDLSNHIPRGTTTPVMYTTVLVGLPPEDKMDPAAQVRFSELCRWLKDVPGLSIDLKKFI